MKFVGLDGRITTLNIVSSKYPVRSREQSKSIKQFQLGQILQQLYSSEVILEEFPIPGTQLRLDFFLPRRMLVVEYDGEQHTNFNKFFHKTAQGLSKQIERDAKKASWCSLNGITLVRVTVDYFNAEILKELIIERS